MILLQTCGPADSLPLITAHITVTIQKHWLTTWHSLLLKPHPSTGATVAHLLSCQISSQRFGWCTLSEACAWSGRHACAWSCLVRPVLRACTSQGASVQKPVPGPACITRHRCCKLPRQDLDCRLTPIPSAPGFAPHVGSRPSLGSDRPSSRRF